MQLNDIIEENTLPSISRKTRISVPNLEALLARDWERLKKVQALGFISILEREYHLDLSDMRAECRAYFDAHAPEEKDLGPVIVATPEPEGRGGSKILPVLLILLLAAGGYFFFSSSPRTSSGEGNESPVAPMERQGGFFDSVMKTAKGWFGTAENQAENTLESPEEEVPAVKGAWAEKNGSAVDGNGEQQNEMMPLNLKKVNNPEKSIVRKMSENSTRTSEDAEEARIIQQVKKEQAKAEEIRKQAAVDGNQSPAGDEGEALSSISKMILAATAGGETSPEGERGTSPVTEGKEAKQPETPARTAMTENTGAAPEAGTSPASVTQSLVVMHPRSKIWVGYTNLRTMKRSTKVTKEDITFDTAKGDYILAVGHGQIDFKTRNGEKKLNDGKRHFFMIARGDVREISHEEFQRLNKSKVW